MPGVGVGVGVLRAALLMASALSLAPPAAHAAGTAKPLTLELYNVSLQQAFDALARSCGLAFDYAGGVRTDRRMSLFLKDAEAESALYHALRANSLEMLPPQDGRVRVVPAADTDDTPTVVFGNSSMLIEVNKDDADVRQQRARMQPAALPAASPATPLAAPLTASPAAPPAAPPAGPAPADRATPSTRSAHSAGTLLDWKIRPRSRVGSNFTVQLFLRSDQPVDAVPLTVSFDGQAFEVMRVEAGGYWGPQSGFSSRVDPQGSIELQAARQGGAPSPSAGGLLAAITFRAANAAPAAHIQIVSARALDAEGRDIGVAVPLRHAMLVQP